jgi:hypothetical protein
MWIWLATGYEHAPFPDLTAPLEHGWDFAIAPVFALVGLRMPEDARPHFVAFQGQRLVEHVIANQPRRVASAWIGTTVLLGAEDSGSSHRVDDQFHPATIHWQVADGLVGWVRLRSAAPVDARAERNKLVITCTAHGGGDQVFIFQVAAPQIELAGLRPDRWELPGLTVGVETNAADLAVARIGELVELRYRVSGTASGAAIQFTLHIAEGSRQ